MKCNLRGQIPLPPPCKQLLRCRSFKTGYPTSLMMSNTDTANQAFSGCVCYVIVEGKRRSAVTLCSPRRITSITMRLGIVILLIAVLVAAMVEITSATPIGGGTNCGPTRGRRSASPIGGGATPRPCRGRRSASPINKFQWVVGNYLKQLG